ncbi:hypothetical protein [Komagataeibacter medellinensis]|nr:hypothetical protein [Komagataeibacter medellinensis]
MRAACGRGMVYDGREPTPRPAPRCNPHATRGKAARMRVLVKPAA